MKSFNVRHIQHRLAAVLAEVEGGEEIEIVRRGRPVARIVPLRSVAQPADWSHAARSPARSLPGARRRRCSRGSDCRRSRGTVSLYYDSGVLVKLYVHEELSDAVTAFVARRGEAITINGLHELDADHRSAMHVAAALSQGVATLVSFDHRQCAAARLTGLEVVEPVA